jgi:hypothetical protein
MAAAKGGMVGDRRSVANCGNRGSNPFASKGLEARRV